MLVGLVEQKYSTKYQFRFSVFLCVVLSVVVVLSPEKQSPNNFKEYCLVDRNGPDKNLSSFQLGRPDSRVNGQQRMISLLTSPYNIIFTSLLDA